MQSNFTVPVLCDYNGDETKEWYVYFTFTFKGVKYERKLREGINRIHDRKQKCIDGEALRKARHQWLEEGWNPILDPKYKLRNIQNPSENRNSSQDQISPTKLTVAMAFQWALNKKKLATKSRQGYQSQLEALKIAIDRLGYNHLPITEFKRYNVKCILEQLSLDKEEAAKLKKAQPNKKPVKKLSNHGYNKYRDTIRTLCSELLEWEVIEYNPALKITSKVVAESNYYEPLTLEEKQQIAEYLLEHHPRYFIYSLAVYHGGVRPKEVLALQIKDIDLKERIITIVPDLDEENAKTPRIRKVAITDELQYFLESIDLQSYPEDYYVFGSPFGIGGARGMGLLEGKRGAMRPDYFLPSPNRVKRDTVTKLWKTIVTEILNIKKHLYALKHTGGDDKILAGVDLDALRSQYGHSTKRMTERYTKGIKKVYQKEIISKSPSFSSKTVES